MKPNTSFRKVIATLLLLGCVIGCSSSEDCQSRYFHKAEALYESGEYKKAVVELRNVLQINPENVDARYLWALIQEKVQNWPGMHKILS